MMKNSYSKLNTENPMHATLYEILLLYMNINCDVFITHIYTVLSSCVVRHTESC